MRRFAAGAATVILVAALWLVASSQGGDAHGRLPIGGGHVKKVSPKVLRLAFARFKPWQWGIWAEEERLSSSRDRVCFSVSIVGPLFHLPDGHPVGSETGGSTCGPIELGRHTVETVPIKEGSQTLPSGKTESWQSFDVGIAAYPPSVGQVRLNFLGGGSEVLKTRAVPDNVAFQGAEPFRYAVFAVDGCVSKVEGLERGRVVARVGQRECSNSAE